jgi:LEA14-like dessication related protein
MNSRRFLVFAFASVLACAGLGGCASLRRSSEDVSVSLANLRPLESTALESRLVLTIRVTNASPEALHLSGSRHRLALNGHALGVAVTPEAIELPALSTTTQEVVFNLSHLALIPLVRELRQEPAARYDIESTFFGASRSSRGMTARHTGRLDLSGFAQASSAAGAGAGATP